MRLEELISHCFIVAKVYKWLSEVSMELWDHNPPPTLGWAGFRTFETRFVRSCAGYPLKNVMTTSYFPKFAGTP
jgi:hypothetical protein